MGVKKKRDGSIFILIIFVIVGIIDPLPSIIPKHDD